MKTSLTQVPLVYFHIMSLTLHTWLAVSSWSAAREVAYTWEKPCATVSSGAATGQYECYQGVSIVALLAQVLVIYLFVGLYTSAVWMSDPMGTRASNYDLNYDLDNLWKEALNAILSMTSDLYEPPVSLLERTDAGFTIKCTKQRHTTSHLRRQRRESIVF